MGKENTSKNHRRSFLSVQLLILPLIVLHLPTGQRGGAIAADIPHLSLMIAPKHTTVSMNSPGIIRRLPSLGGRTNDIADNFKAEALVYKGVLPEFAHNSSLDQVIFNSYPSRSPQGKIQTELYTVSKQVEHFRETFGYGLAGIIGGSVTSKHPINDALAMRIRSSRDDSRLTDLENGVRAIFLENGTFPIPAPENAGVLPTSSLEKRIHLSLDPKKVRFLAVDLALDESSTRKAAAILLSSIIRDKAGLSPVPIVNPSYSLQRLALNDVALHSGHKHASIPINVLISELGKYCMESKAYWGKLKESGLYGDDDIALLRLWKIIPDNDPKKNPIIYIADPSFVDPLDRINYECTQAEQAYLKYIRDLEMTTAVAKLLIKDFVAPGLNPLPKANEEAAKTMAASIGMAGSEVQAKLVPAISAVKKRMQSYFGTNESLVALQQSVSAQHFANTLANALGPRIAVDIAETEWGLRIKGLMGGVETSPFISRWAFVETDKTEMDFQVIIDNIGKSFSDPTMLYENYKALRDWRETLSRSIVTRKRDWLEDLVYAIERTGTDRLDSLRNGMEKVSRGEDLVQALIALNEPLGYNDYGAHWEGRLAIPSDSVVVALHATVGEYVEVGRPVITVQHAYRRTARLYLEDAALKREMLVPGAVYELSIDEKPLGIAGLVFAAVIKDILPSEPGKWIGELEVFPAIDIKHTIGSASGLPQYVPLKDSFCRTDGNPLTPDACKAARELLPLYGTISVTIPKRLE